MATPAICARPTTAGHTQRPSSCQRRSRIRPATAASLRERLAATLKVARERQALVYNEPPDSEDTKCVLKSFTDFVELCERKERETGEPVRIAARY